MGRRRRVGGWWDWKSIGGGRWKEEEEDGKRGTTKVSRGVELELNTEIIFRRG